MKLHKHVISGGRLYWIASFLLIFLQTCQPIPVTTNLATDRTASTYESTTSHTALPATLLPQKLTAVSTSTQIITPMATSYEATQIFHPAVTNTPIPPVIFAALGDYGSGEQAEADVAKLILSWHPDFIITLGDNNYPNGAADHIDAAIGQFFHGFISPYTGSYGAGAEENRFFPSLGNHDLMSDQGKPYYDYFTLPGDERYYDFVWGPLHLFALDTMDSEPDGVGASSKQGEWLREGLAVSSSSWNIVYMHYPPYSSGLHGSTDWARWPYGEWGADVVLSAHDHTYERLLVDGMTYFVNGLGGYSIYDFVVILDGSQVRYNSDYGAMRMEATSERILFEFINRSGEVVDSYVMTK